MMKAIITGQHFEFTDKTLTVSKSVGIYECEFVFDSSWDGWDKTTVFEGSGQTIEVVISDDRARVPWEVLQRSGWMKVGVYGTQGDLVRPTVWGERLLVRVGTPTGSIGTEPTASIYAQILAVADEAKEIAEEAYDKAETAQDSAKSHAEESEAWAVGQRDGKDVDQSDEAYQNNSKFWAEVAQQGAEESGFVWFDVDENTGEAMVTITDSLDEDVSFEVNTATGELEVVFV